MHCELLNWNHHACIGILFVLLHFTLHDMDYKYKIFYTKFKSINNIMQQILFLIIDGNKNGSLKNYLEQVMEIMEFFSMGLYLTPLKR